MPTHHDYILQTIQLCQQSDAKPSPNPKVACLIVKDNQVIGQGIHQGAGTPHAEILAIANATVCTIGADLYVNLEPCCHYGRTPPCTAAIIKAGIRKVFIAMLDPNPLVQGKGVAYLKQHGIEVHIGFHEPLAKQLNTYFCYAITHQKPFVIAKWAMSLNGELATHLQCSNKISNQQAHLHSHQLRNQVDAILIGKLTANIDNPLLTTRHNNQKQLHQPIRIILAKHADLDSHLQLLSKDMPNKTIIVVDKKITDKELAHLPNHIQTIKITVNNSGFDLDELLTTLYQLNIHSLLIEGGARTLNHWLQQNKCQQYHVYIAPILASKKIPSTYLTNTHLQQLDNNLFIQANT